MNGWKGAKNKFEEPHKAIAISIVENDGSLDQGGGGGGGEKWMDSRYI